MTDLQTSLMAIGGAILVGVISYNKWQEYKAQKSMERLFVATHDDSSATEVDADYPERHEPSLAPPAVDEPLDLPEPVTRLAPTMVAQPQKELPVDEVIDCTIPLMLDAPVRGEKLLNAMQTLRHASNKPIHFIGRQDDGTWESIATGNVYTALSAGVQLANRRHALNELEYSELVTQLRQIADQFDAELDVPDMTRVIAAARELHQFILEYDAKLSANVVSNGAPWAINTLLAALERQGFDIRPDGRLVMPDGDGGTLFSLSTNVTLAAETTSRLTLLLDVPCVAASRDGLCAMMACAKMLAARLGGRVVDDSDRLISELELAEISAQVATFYAHMQEASVPAGSTRAMRLFS